MNFLPMPASCLGMSPRADLMNNVVKISFNQHSRDERLRNILDRMTSEDGTVPRCRVISEEGPLIQCHLNLSRLEGLTADQSANNGLVKIIVRIFAKVVGATQWNEEGGKDAVITSVDLSNNAISGSSLAGLQMILSQMTCLNMNGTRISQEGVAYINQHFPSLQQFSCGND